MVIIMVPDKGTRISEQQRIKTSLFLALESKFSIGHQILKTYIFDIEVSKLEILT